jgi:hypothetical protein
VGGSVPAFRPRHVGELVIVRVFRGYILGFLPSSPSKIFPKPNNSAWEGSSAPKFLSGDGFDPSSQDC